MTVTEKRDRRSVYCNLCIAMIWCIAAYSSIIQSKFFQISNGMLILGAAILVFYILTFVSGSLTIQEMLTEENGFMLAFMIYILIVGLLFSPNRANHLSQWITSLEYLFIQIVLASIIKRFGTITFHGLLVVLAIIIAVVFINEPVNYLGTGRYSISNEVNPNGLGMGFAAGIWAVLYFQQKTKVPLILVGLLVALFGYCIIMTGSRKSIIGGGLAIVIWLIFCYIPSLKGKGLFFGIISVLVMALLIIIIGKVLLNIYENLGIAERMNNLLVETADGNRRNMYRDGIELLKENPLFGLGFSGFKYFFGFYSHATLVEIPVSGGVCGVLLYLYVYYISIKKQIRIFTITKEKKDYYSEHKRIKMIMILFTMMVFYTTCIIHPYQFDSSILFGIIFGETAYLENKIRVEQETTTPSRRIGSKYIRYE